MFRRSTSLRLGLATCVLAAAPQGIRAQSAPVQPDSPMSVDRAYAVAFRMVASMQKRAAEIETTGGKGAGLRQAFGNKAGLTAEEADVLNRVAARAEELGAPLDEQAWALIKAVRNRYRDGKMPPEAPVPPPPEELELLQRERDRIVSEAVADLRRELGPNAFAKLDRYIRQSMLTAAPRKQPIQTPSEIGRPGSPRLSPPARPKK